MNIIGVGVDIVDIQRLREARHLDRVAEYVLNADEIAELHGSRDSAQFIASRLACKEALIKASPEPLTYHDITVAKEGTRPVANTPKLVGAVHLSLSHEFRYAVAHATVTE